ncbi:MAG: hypothetical protein ACYDHP_13565 [Ferrimicrobium sp.]
MKPQTGLLLAKTTHTTDAIAVYLHKDLIMTERAGQARMQNKLEEMTQVREIFDNPPTIDALTTPLPYPRQEPRARSACGARRRPLLR